MGTDRHELERRDERGSRRDRRAGEGRFREEESSDVAPRRFREEDSSDVVPRRFFGRRGGKARVEKPRRVPPWRRKAPLAHEARFCGEDEAEWSEALLAAAGRTTVTAAQVVHGTLATVLFCGAFFGFPLLGFAVGVAPGALLWKGDLLWNGVQIAEGTAKVVFGIGGFAGFGAGTFGLVRFFGWMGPLVERLGKWSGRTFTRRPHPDALLEGMKWLRRPPIPDVRNRARRARDRPPSLDALTAGIRDRDWGERFEAVFGLRARGPEAAPVLLAVATDPGAKARDWAAMVLEPWASEQDEPAAGAVCPTCAVRARRRSVARTPGALATPRAPFTLWACPVCRGIEGFVAPPGGVVARLDRGAAPGRIEREGGRLVVEVHDRNAPIDLARLEIVDATDAEAEEFAIEIANEPDEERRRSNARAEVVVDPGCALSDNTLEVLRRTFGAVRVEPLAPRPDGPA